MDSRTLITAFSFFAFGSILMACAPAGGDTARSTRGPITAAEINEAGITTTALDAVRRLRPEWLTIRGRSDISDRSRHRLGDTRGENEDIRVYVNGLRIGYTASALNTIPVVDIKNIERLSASQATTLFGAGHFSGAFSIETR